MDEFQKEEEFLFEENEENIVIKYKLLRSLIIKHYNRGCKYLEIAKVVCAAFFLISPAALFQILCNPRPLPHRQKKSNTRRTLFDYRPQDTE